MATRSLPERPNLEQLRKQARELQRSLGPDVRLSAAQLALARQYGFASWPRLAAHVSAIEGHTWTWTAPTDAESAVDAFVRLVCVDYTDPVVEPGAAVPSPLSLAAAAAAADADAVASLVGPEVDAPSGPFGWTPLMYLAYSRAGAEVDATLRTARLLLEAGADPNAGRYFLGYPTPFTVLTGVFGDGEDGQPAHPHALALARLLLDAGADPNDGQTLYNRMFSTEDDWLELLFSFGLGRGDGGPWRRRLPDLTPAPDVLVRRLLGWAVAHDQRDRVALLARHGVDVAAPLPDGAFGAVGTPIQVALANGHRALADLLRSLGVDQPSPDPVSAPVGAVLAADVDALRTASADDLAAARAARPGLIVLAAARGVAAVEAALAAGWPLDALGRSDAPVEQPWQTALHTAVECDDIALVARLLELGADTSIRDARFGGTPLDWARHLGRPDVEALLAG